MRVRTSGALIPNVLLALRMKPFCYNFPERSRELPQRGILCLSADVEMAWGWRFAVPRGAGYEVYASRERANFTSIRDKLDQLKIAVTWAVVGHLLLDSCKRENGRAHSDMLRPMFFRNEYWHFDEGDWYDNDPCADYKSAPNWYAPDMIREILSSRVEHEVACHSFSHIGFNERYCSMELADAELRKCEEVTASFGIKPVSMVFPGNEPGHFDLLAKYGYKCVRYFPRRRVEISLPMKLKEGLWAIPESSNIVPDDNWNSKYILWRLKKYIDKAVKKRVLCHLWFHPSITGERIQQVLFPILEYCVRKRDEGQLDIMTMKAVAEMMEKKCAV